MNRIQYESGEKNGYWWATRIAVILSVLALVIMVVYISIKGIPNLEPELFAWKYTSNNGSMTPFIITTVILLVCALLLAVPISLMAAIYLQEYAPKNSKLVVVIRLAAETLAGIPSIVYGLFGYIFFVYNLKLGYSLASGTLTAMIMVLPILMRSTEEAISQVPQELKEASFALGAGKLRTLTKIILKEAMPGIAAAIFLAIARIVSETAALLHTLGAATNMIKNFGTSSRTLALHLYMLSNEGFHVDKAFATAFILLVLVLALNQASNYFLRKASRQNAN